MSLVLSLDSISTRYSSGLAYIIVRNWMSQRENYTITVRFLVPVDGTMFLGGLNNTRTITPNVKLACSFTQRRSRNEDLGCVLFSENSVMGFKYFNKGHKPCCKQPWKIATRGRVRTTCSSLRLEGMLTPYIRSPVQGGDTASVSFATEPVTGRSHPGFMSHQSCLEP